MVDTVSRTPIERGTSRIRFYTSYFERARLLSHLPRVLSAAAVSIVSWTTLNLFTSTPKSEWVQLPGNHFANSAPRSMPAGGAQHAVVDRNIPMFTRIAAVSPALLALPLSEPEQNAEREVATAEDPSHPEAEWSETQTISLTEAAKPSFS